MPFSPIPDSRGGRRRLVVLGSTGSVGRNALEVAACFPDRLEVVGLAAGRQADLLAEQAARFGWGPERCVSPADLPPRRHGPGGDGRALAARGG
jgi:hypothetical protein